MKLCSCTPKRSNARWPLKSVHRSALPMAVCAARTLGVTATSRNPYAMKPIITLSGLQDNLAILVIHLPKIGIMNGPPRGHVHARNGDRKGQFFGGGACSQCSFGDA